MISYAGVDLLLPDLEGWVDLLVRRHLPLEDLRLFGALPAPLTTVPELPRVNYPDPPRLKLNSLYWPTGATRFARGVFLCNDDQLDTILKAVDVRGVQNLAAQLVIGQGTFAASSVGRNSFLQNDKGVALSTSMYLLQPRPAMSMGDGTNLWFLPLVDERYYWQGRYAAPTSEAETWDDLFNACSAALNSEQPGGLVWDEVHADYGDPPAVLLDCRDNAAVFLDYLAHYVGQRVVRCIDRSILSLNATNAVSQLDTNYSDQGKYIWVSPAGDALLKHFSSITPTSVNVFFKTSATPTAVTAASLGYEKITAAFEQGIHTLHASSSLVAIRFAYDYYAWLQKSLDQTFHGVKYWQPSGFEDAIEWSPWMQHFDRDGQAKGLCQTRVWGMPPDVGIFDFGIGADRFGLRLAKYTVTNVAKGGTATFTIYDPDTEIAYDPVETVEAKSRLQSYVRATFCYVGLVDGNWEIVSYENGSHAPIRGILGGTLSSGGTQTLLVSRWTGTAWVDSGTTEPVYEMMGLLTPIIAGSTCVAIWFPELTAYGVISAKCPST